LSELESRHSQLEKPKREHYVKLSGTPIPLSKRKPNRARPSETCCCRQPATRRSKFPMSLDVIKEMISEIAKNLKVMGKGRKDIIWRTITVSAAQIISTEANAKKADNHIAPKV